MLSDDGPYQLGGRAWSFRRTAPLANPDLTIKAEAGVRPVLKFASDARLADRPPESLLHFVGGHVIVDGVAFDLDVISPDEPVAAVRAEGTELTLRGCSFKRSSSREGRNVAAVSIRQSRPPASLSDRPPAVFVDMCHFDGGQTAILATGLVDLALRNCTMGPAEPSIWFDNPPSSSPVPADVRLSRSSIMAGTEPVFRFDGTQVRVWLDDCAIAPAGQSSATLVMIDNPRDLAWHGRSNVYSGIAVFQTTSARGERQEPIVEFAALGRNAGRSSRVRVEVLCGLDLGCRGPLRGAGCRDRQPDPCVPVESDGRPGKRRRRQHRSLRIDHQEHGGCQALPRLARRAPAGRAAPNRDRFARSEQAPRLRRRDRGRGSATSSDAAFGVEQPGSGPHSRTTLASSRPCPRCPPRRHSFRPPRQRELRRPPMSRRAGLANFPRRGKPVVGPRGSRPRAARWRSPHCAARPGNHSHERSVRHGTPPAQQQGRCAPDRRGRRARCSRDRDRRHRSISTAGRIRREKAPAAVPAGAVRPAFAGRLDRDGRRSRRLASTRRPRPDRPRSREPATPTAWRPSGFFPASSSR